MKHLQIVAMCLFGLLSSVVMAEEADAEKLIKQNLKQIDARIQVKSIADAALNGMKEVELQSGEVVYADPKGEYFLIGQLYQFSEEAGFVNLTEEKSKAQRVEQLAAITEDQMVVYAPEGEVKATLNVFTDVDCPYCRKLHAEVPQLNKMGIQVNYLAFPRNGEGTPAHRTMVSIWCSKDAQAKRDAMTAAKTGSSVTPSSCVNPVMDQFALGQAMGVRGTPALVLADGSLVPGYIPAERLAVMLGVN